MKITILVSLILTSFLSYSQFTSLDQCKGIAVGDTVESFSALTVDSANFNYNKDSTENDVVVIFIRGEWCPYCNQHLQKLQDSMKLLTDKGADLLIISPEKPSYLEKKQRKIRSRIHLALRFWLCNNETI